MNKIEFESHIIDGIHEYHFILKDTELIISNSEHFSNNKDLWDDWSKVDGMPISYERFNISNLGTGENILLYMLFIKELTLEKDLFGVGIWETDSIETTLNEKPHLIGWEYRLEHEYVKIDNYKKQDIGFVKAKSPVITQYSKPINRTPINKAGLFELNSFQQFSDFFKPGFGDADNMTNFYTSDNFKELISNLSSEQKPSFDKLLTDENLFIALLVGEDFGYYDYLLVKSKVDISQKIQDTLDKIHGFAEYYIEMIKKIKTSKEMIDLIDKGIAKYALQSSRWPVSK